MGTPSTSKITGPHCSVTSGSLHAPNSVPFSHATLFPPLVLPKSRPNTLPRANQPLMYINEHDTPAQSNLNPDAWQLYLNDYPDPVFPATLNQIMRSGANLGCSGTRVGSQECPNLPSALIHASTISLDIAKQLTNGRTNGPFPQPPLANFRCSPLGAVTRKHSSKTRRIHHLSWPTGTSVNDGILEAEGMIVYDSFARAVDDLIASGPGSLFVKLDLEAAFRQIPVRPDDWHLLGFKWDGQYYFDTVLAFGLRSAPYIFNLFAEGLHWIMQRHLPARIRHYLDDFLATFAPSLPAPTVNAALDWSLLLGHHLGLSFQESKVIGPATTIEYLGITLDSIAMEARLPADKHRYLLELLHLWRTRSHCTLQDLQELSGFLQFTSQVIPLSRAFLCAFYTFSSSFRSRNTRRRITSAVRRDLDWWLAVSTTWNGIRLLTPNRPVLHIFTDASGTKGIGGIFSASWFATRIPRRYRKHDIQFKELFAVLHAVLCWGEHFRAHHVVFHVDNQAVCAALESLTNRSPPVMQILRSFLELACRLDFSFSSSWLSSAANAIADAASRFLYTRLFELAPHLDSKPSIKALRPLGTQTTPNGPRPSHFTYFTVSHPPHETHTQQDNVPFANSPSSMASSTGTGTYSQPPNRPSLHGSRPLPAPYSHPPSKHTLLTSNHSTSNPASTLQHASLHWSSASSVESSGTMANEGESQSNQSPSQCSTTSSPISNPTRTLSTTSLPLLPASHSQASYAAVSLPRATINLTPPSIYPGVASASYQPWMQPLISPSLYRPQRPIPFVKGSPSTLRPHQVSHPAPLQQCRNSFRTTHDLPMLPSLKPPQIAL